MAKPKRVLWFKLKSEMCIRVPAGSDDSTSVTVVDCRAEHQAEVMGRTRLQGPKKWPSDDALDDAALGRCERSFEAYVGLTYEDSRLDVQSFTPDSAGWEAGDRTLVCLVVNPEDDTITEALKGSAQ
jgi:hypothetical protein